MKKKIICLLSGVLVAVSLVGVRNSQFVAFAKDKIVTKYRYDRSDQKKLKRKIELLKSKLLF